MQAQPANPVIDDLAQNNIALHRLSLVHLRCVEIAQRAEAVEHEGQNKEAERANDSTSISKEVPGYGRQSQSP